MNILIVSCESWRDTNNGGNVLSNIFCAFPDAEIAQIYCSGELPKNTVCRRYFQISDSMLLGKEKGRKLEEKNYSTDAGEEQEVIDNRIKNKIPEFFRESALFAREILWEVFNWKTKELEKFIKDFKPDIIFAPCYSYYHVSKLALYAKNIADCPMISYISDDNYSLKRVCFNPFFWINRLITRKWIRRHFGESSLIYTMTELQKKEYEALFRRPMKILCKSAVFEETEKKVGTPIKFIYAGGLYLNRWKVLAELAESLKKINETQTQTKAQLHIFSGSKLNADEEKKISDGKNSFFHGQISYKELTEQYKKADVAVHAESFDLKNRLITRLSFSTKIIDCMNSGCAVLAVGPEDQAGIAYLKENDGAICVNDMRDLYSTVAGIVEQPALITEYSKKAACLGRKNHTKEDIEKMLREDFLDVASGGSKNN